MNLLAGIFLATIIEMVPFEDKYGLKYIGIFPGSNICEATFSFGPGTILAPGTELAVSPFKEVYGTGSIIQYGDGGREFCGACAVYESTMDATGVTRFYCDVY